MKLRISYTRTSPRKLSLTAQTNSHTLPALPQDVYILPIARRDEHAQCAARNTPRLNTVAMGGRSRGRVKRQQVASDDGWTVITHGVSGLSLDKGADISENNAGNKSAHSLPVRTVFGMTPESLLADFKKLQQRWVDTACAEHVARLLADKTWDVTDAVCIGIGSFSRDWEHRHRALWQLVLFLDVVSKGMFGSCLLHSAW